MENEMVLTDEGYNKLIDELDFLQNTKRREVAKRIKTAIEFGDISENSEYDDAKNEQAFIEGRISQINDALSKCRLIDSKEVTTDKVGVGCRVKIKDLETGDIEEYRLVGSVEADPENHKISNESPVGRAILGKTTDQVVKVATPVGVIDYLICGISK
ncbi:MAG TPA: transcription elongation factor GreA [Actinobacteria bacterium]|nr:transcription elongation factor GreA [Actinomycetes bacterium]HEX21046.1 transcription elongation factor GreA [Actinomycetota bacterium]